MKVLYLTTGLGRGGAEKVLVSLADQAVKDGIEVKIAYMCGKPLITPDSSFIEIIPLKISSICSLPFGFFRLLKIIKSFGPDVVHSHMIHANILARFARYFIDIPKLICTAHSSNEGGKFRMLLYRITDAQCDFFTNVSAEASASLELAGAAPAGRIIPIPNGIDVEKFKPKLHESNDVFTIIAIGRLEPPKDYPNLLRAIKMLSALNAKFKVLIVGEGTLFNSLNTLAHELGIEDYVVWLGFREDIPNLFNRSDMFVLSSAFEGFGLVVAEAMSCELPVLATDCGGVSEVVGDAHWLVPTNAPNEIALKIYELINMSKHERKLLGLRNRQRIIHRYSLTSMYKNYIGLYYQ